MAKYYVNDRAQGNGDHEVHREGCPYLPSIISKTYIGDFFTCVGAVAAAKMIYKRADGCKTCSEDCHTS